MAQHRIDMMVAMTEREVDSRAGESWLITESGQRLFFRRWPAAEARAVVVIAHGFGEHGGRYRTLVESFVGARFAVYAADHRGHGRSEGARGHVANWSEYRHDLAAFVRLVGDELPGLPLFLLGHSMGALIALDLALHQDCELRGLIVSAIGFRPGTVAHPVQVMLARMLGRVTPRLRLSMAGLDASQLSRDPVEVDAYRADPLVHSLATMAWGSGALRAVALLRRRAVALDVPILVTHGAEDPVALAAGSEELFATVTFGDKELRIYPGAAHEPHNDLCRQQVAADMRSWIEAHLPDRAPAFS